MLKVVTCPQLLEVNPGCPQCLPLINFIHVKLIISNMIETKQLFLVLKQYIVINRISLHGVLSPNLLNNPLPS